MKFFYVIFSILLISCGEQQTSNLTSITDDDYIGKKYYLGWGAAANGDPSSMHNEVKYDVLHTHNVFTQDIGGNYIGTQLIANQATSSNIKQSWQEITSKMTWNDMYIQYSSGHGSPTGLGVGVSYDQIRDATLAMPAKEVIVFIMACRSGGLVNSFNNKKAEWEHRGQQGRTLFVMASSSVSTDSSTGPGTDPDEPNAPNGSAGSAFGHALWKAIIGYADGYNGGTKDGKITLGELEDYTKDRTSQVGGHTPVMTGVYSRDLVMVKVPPKWWVDLQEAEGGTGSMADDEVVGLLQNLRENNLD